MKRFWTMGKVAKDEGEITLYGVISSESWWGDEVTPKQFKSDLDALGDIKTLNVRINSPGGDVFAGSAIYSMLKRHSAQKIVYIDGLAASMASVVAMAGDLVIMPKNAMLMIHNPWGGCVGFASEMRAYADLLDKIGESMMTAYTDKTGKTVEDIKSVMDAETWFTAEEAVAAGWADEIEESKKVAACASGDLILFDKVAVDPSRFRAFPKEKIELSEPGANIITANITASTLNASALSAGTILTNKLISIDDPPKTTAAAPLEIYQAKIKIHARRAKHL